MNLIKKIGSGKLKGTLVLLSLFLIFSGCSSMDEKFDKPEEFNKWRILAEESQPVTPVPEAPPVQMEPELENQTLPEKDSPEEEFTDLPVPTPQLPEMPVTMRMHDVSVPVLLRTLARIADINIMINETVQGEANIDIKNVPWNQAFNSLLDTYSLSYEWSGMILRVVTVEDLNKKKTLMEAKQDYEQSKNEHSIAMMQIKKKQDRFEPLLTKIVKIHYADLKVLQLNLEKYLNTDIKDTGKEQSTIEGTANPPDKMRGSILIDEFTNSLILQATRSDINKIMPIINELDRPIKQIRIVSHIVEASSDIAKELGIQWGGLGLGEPGDGKKIWVGGDMGPSGTSLKDSDGNNTTYNPDDGTIVNLPITPMDPYKGLALGVMAETLGSFRLYAQLSALEQEGDLNILSKPSITTMDHRKAIIKSGKVVPFQSVSVDGTNIEYKEAVIKLEVIPHIISDEIIRLEIVVHKDELDWNNTVNGNPTIITNNAETRVTLFDGQTTVIGGLNKELSADGESGVPGVKDIQGLGWLFKSKKKTKAMEELLIFITPFVLNEQSEMIKPEQK